MLENLVGCVRKCDGSVSTCGACVSKCGGRVRNCCEQCHEVCCVELGSVVGYVSKFGRLIYELWWVVLGNVWG